MVQAVTRPRAQGYGASIGDDWFRLAPAPDAPLRVYTRDSLAERQDQAGSPDENVLDLGYAFSRSNLTGGEGLDWWPRVAGETPTDTDLIRFWDSSNVDVSRPDSGEPYKLTLTKDLESFWTPPASPADMGASRESVYIIEGTNVHRFDDLADVTPDDTDNIGVTLVQIAVGLDGSVAVLDTAGDVWFKSSQADAYLKVYDSTVDGPALDALAIWYVKSRIMAYCNDTGTAADSVLLEISPSILGAPATPTAGVHTYTILDTGSQPYAIIDAGHAIVAAYSDGSLRSYVPQSDSAGELPLLTVRGRTQVPVGEVPYALGHNLGTLLVFTLDTNLDHARLYTASVLDVRFDYVVGALQLLRTWKESGETAPNYTKAVVSTRDELFFWMAESPTNSLNLWRMDLVTTGLFRQGKHLRATATGSVVFEDRLHFIDGAAVISESATVFLSSGYLITPNITFGLNTAINWVSFILEAQDLTGSGVSVELWRTEDPGAILDPDDGNWILVDTLTSPLQSGIERSIVNATSTTLALQLKLSAATNNLTAPNATRFATRGFPKHRDWIAEVPINVRDIVNAPGRMPVRVPGHGDTVHDLLLLKDGAATELVLLDPPLTLRGVVDQLMEPVSYITDRGSQGRFCMMVFRGNRTTTTTSAQAQGNAGMGIGPMGITTMGIGEI